MILIETASGFHVVADPARSSNREFIKALLAHFRAHDIPFSVGGERPEIILTLGPMSPARRAELRQWWSGRSKHPG